MEGLEESWLIERKIGVDCSVLLNWESPKQIPKVDQDRLR
jgi:hypothetical protein